MKYKFKVLTKNKTGDVRIINYFDILPVCINDELRWLEYVTIEQVYQKGTTIGQDYSIPDNWLNIRFIDEEL